VTIHAVAIRRQGVIYTLPRPARHHDVIAFMAGDCGMPTPITGEQGFLTQIGEFVDRLRGAEIAVSSGQVAELQWPPSLFSEDLW
jgi:hypothetical protein